MKVFSKIEDVRTWIKDVSLTESSSLGFVPTMGALHQGHISLVEKSVAENSHTAASIFVNPIQFNNQSDLVNYPRTMEEDLEMLKQAGCDMVFAPTEKEMYPGEVTEQYDFGDLERVMEGEFRPGHFNGVAVVVKRLFDIVKPDRAYFGEKDFQQLCIIKKLVEQTDLDIEVIGCPIIREPDGLAMSSRNRRLGVEERKRANEIYKTLVWIRDNLMNATLDELREEAHQNLDAVAGMKVEYLRFADLHDLQPVQSIEQKTKGVGVFVAAWLGDVRLIDNMVLIS